MDVTAINLVVQRDRAHLLTDGAQYDHAGRVRTLCSKTLIAEEIRLAVAPSGRLNSVELRDGLVAAGANSQAEVMAALPRIVATVRAKNAADLPAHEGGGDNDAQLFVVLWSDARDEPQGWMLSTNCLPHWGPYRPLTWVAVDAMIGTLEPADQALGRAVTLADPSSFDAARDGLTILEHQRRTPWPDGIHYVGGHAELVTVTRDGVEQRRLREWPDTVGQLIQP